MCAALGNKNHQLLSTDKQLVREGIRSQIEGEALAGEFKEGCSECKDGACAACMCVTLRWSVGTFIFI